MEFIRLSFKMAGRYKNRLRAGGVPYFSAKCVHIVWLLRALPCIWLDE